ncbi:hypothetical protein PanWU01x14_088280 [Parasponia andersonii]|uniref:Uncharacterized protein n=1 Tax=Parasponia andersonii TaxID=3476 RepID=A0A2P5D7V1_PARAD|nr:hypothetical protein PanWU01x14_088280 [Parasponia andersonii]
MKRHRLVVSFWVCFEFSLNSQHSKLSYSRTVQAPDSTPQLSRPALRLKTLTRVLGKALSGGLSIDREEQLRKP